MSTNRKKILIVDDNVVVLKALSMKLRANGYDVLTSVDSAGAISAVRREEPELILLDIDFPADSWDGFRMMNWLQRMNGGKEIPVIIMTGGESKEKDRFLAAGAVGFFLKPIDHGELVTLIRKTLNEELPEAGLKGVQTAMTSPSPLNLPVEEEVPEPASQAMECDPKLILMLEDDVAFGETLQLFLESHSFQVVRVANGAEALRQIRATDVDIVLCDIVLPDMPADQFYLAVERSKPRLCKRFIFMTGHQADPKSDGFIRRVRALMLWKPFPLPDLLTAIEAVWRKSRVNATPPGLGRSPSKPPPVPRW